jgi:hypothetical protein
MTALLLAVFPAHAGVIVELDVGPAFPLEESPATKTGANLALAAGYRWSFGLLHLRPEAIARLNTGADAGAIGLGGAATFGPAILAFGPYAHVAGAVGGGDGANVDAGALFEVTALPVVFLGARIGWQQDRSGQSGTDDFLATWLVVGVDL